MQSIKSHQSISHDDEKSLTYTVCSNHFLSTELKGKPFRLSSTAYPTVFPATTNECGSLNNDEFSSNDEIFANQSFGLMSNDTSNK